MEKNAPGKCPPAKALSFGRSTLLYNAASTGSQVYLKPAKEFLNGKKGTR